MKEPTGNTEAELQYWQGRALSAEAELPYLRKELEVTKANCTQLEQEVHDLERELAQMSRELTLAHGELENQMYNSRDYD